MKKIEKPYWTSIFVDPDGVRLIPRSEINKWFDTHVQPVNDVIENASQAWGFKDIEGKWYFDTEPCEEDTHTALLVGIESLKDETAEDLLREIVAHYDGNVIMERDKEFLARAKAALGESDE